MRSHLVTASKLDCSRLGVESYQPYPYRVLWLNLKGVEVTLSTAGNCRIWATAGNSQSGAIAFAQLPQKWAVAVGVRNPTLLPSIASHGSFLWGLVRFPIDSGVSLAGLV